MQAPFASADVAAVLQLVSERTGMELWRRQRDATERAVRRAMKDLGIHDVERFYLRISSDRQACDALIDQLVVGETYFFRDPQHFRFIRSTITPEATRAPDPSRKLRVWSAGCATGEEPYSLAILFHELGMRDRVEIFASDISRSNLERASRGVFGSWSISRGSFDGFERHFARKGPTYTLAKAIQERVTFEHHNLLDEALPAFATVEGSFDLIVCRNVLIYFDPQAVRSVAMRFYKALAPGGWLIPGPSDPPLASHAPFEIIMSDAGLAYRRPAEMATVPPAGFGCAIETVALSEAQEDDDGLVAAHIEAPLANAPAPEAFVEALRRARRAFARGDYQCVAAMAPTLLADEQGAVCVVRALANLGDGARATATAQAALARHPLSTALHYVHALLLSSLGMIDDAITYARRAVFLDGALAMPQFALGSLLHRKGDLRGAQRAYQNARDLCLKLPANETVAFAEGDAASTVARAAQAQLALIESALGTAP